MSGKKNKKEYDSLDGKPKTSYERHQLIREILRLRAELEALRGVQVALNFVQGSLVQGSRVAGDDNNNDADNDGEELSSTLLKELFEVSEQANALKKELEDIKRERECVVTHSRAGASEENTTELEAANAALCESVNELNRKVAAGCAEIALLREQLASLVDTVSKQTATTSTQAQVIADLLTKLGYVTTK